MQNAAHAAAGTAEGRLHQLRAVQERLATRPNDPHALVQAIEVMLADRIAEMAELLGEPA
jgi:hypothetical protein